MLSFFKYKLSVASRSITIGAIVSTIGAPAGLVTLFISLAFTVGYGFVKLCSNMMEKKQT